MKPHVTSFSVAVGLGMAAMSFSGPAHPQNANDLIRLFGGVVQATIAQATVAQWQKLPQSEIVCLDQQLRQAGSSITDQINNGVGPGDPRVLSFRNACSNARTQASENLPVAEAPRIAPSIYQIDGLQLGGTVNFTTPIFRDFQCRPSDQYPKFTWCTRAREETNARGKYVSQMTILHGVEGTARYINRYLEPAWFAGNEVNDDIARLAKRYGVPQVIDAPFAVGAPSARIAKWGDVGLERLDAASMDKLANGLTLRAGLLIDHIGNFRRSAQLGLPIYRLTGRAGYVWAASWNAAGEGTLRFLTIDASRLIGEEKVADAPPVLQGRNDAFGE
jgi:hypothetical protein